ncbi:MAG: carbohydrate ABC transporter permease [Thermomicrobiales bacterium]
MHSPMGRSLEERRRRLGLALVTPALVVLALVVLFPIARAVVYSFQSVTPDQGAFRSRWVWFDNYRFMGSDPAVKTALRNTIFFTVGEVVLVISIALLTALLLHHPFGRFGAFRVILLIPWAIAPVANAVLWEWILHGSYGVLNAVLLRLGLIDQYTIWLGDADLALRMVLLADVWKSVPFIALLLLAGLQNIPRHLYRAAKLDGATAWQRFRFVTVPGLRTPLTLAMILQTIWAIKVFDLIYVLTKGGPGDGTLMANFLAYRVTFNYLNFGYGAALANVIFLAMLLLSFVYIKVLKPGTPRSRSVTP